MVLRLAEQYLIRAEARARQQNISGAVEDIDVIRLRAGLPLFAEINPAPDQVAMIGAIRQECARRVPRRMGNTLAGA